jgi:hypothetical protein
LRRNACIELISNGNFYSAADKDLEAIPPTATGIYLFCRRYGQNLWPQYVGRSRRLRRRIRDHLERVSLMRALSEGESGRRVVLVAIVEPQRGQSPGRVAAEVESLLIRRFRAAAFNLVNEKGNRGTQRTVHWHGSRDYVELIPRRIRLARP